MLCMVLSYGTFLAIYLSCVLESMQVDPEIKHAIHQWPVVADNYFDCHLKENQNGAKIYLKNLLFSSLGTSAPMLG